MLPVLSLVLMGRSIIQTPPLPRPRRDQIPKYPLLVSNPPNPITQELLSTYILLDLLLFANLPCIYGVGEFDGISKWENGGRKRFECLFGLLLARFIAGGFEG